MKKLNKISRSNLITLAMVAAAYLVMQILSSLGLVSNLLRGQLVPICAYAVMAVSLNLCVGILGELSLGHAGFMSVGAFSGAIAISCMEAFIPNPIVRLILGMIVGAVFASLAGIVIGIPVLKLDGDYLAIVTLAFGEIIRSIMTNVYVAWNPDGLKVTLLEMITPAEGGKMIVNGAIGLTGLVPISTFTVGIVLLIICLVVVFNLTNSKTGRAIMALRDNKIAASCVGISVTKYKLLAFVVSAAIAGAAGTLFAENYSAMRAVKFDFNTSILILVFVVLGGLGNVRGSIIAATILTLIPELLRSIADYRMLAYAIVLIVVMLASNNPAFKEFFAGLKTKIGNFVRSFIFKKGGSDHA